MSGGSLDYGYSKINQVIESIQDALESEHELSEAIKSKMLTLIQDLEKASNNAYRLEWYSSWRYFRRTNGIKLEKNMQAELKFDLSNEDDKIEYLLAQRGARFHSMIYDIEMLLRSKSKHGDYQHEETHIIVDAIYGEVLDIISGYNEDIP
jgi:hypothetical protein